MTGATIDFDRAAGITRIEDNNGNAISITSSGIVHTAGKSIAFTRDAQNRITRIIDPMGRVLTYAYADGDLVEFVDQVDNRTTFSYDAGHTLLEINDPAGNRAFRAEYDVEGRLIAMIDGRGRRIEFSHDLALRQEVTTDARGSITRLVYSGRGDVSSRQSTVTIEGAQVLATTAYQHDASGNEIAVVDPDGVRVDAVYDQANPLEVVVDPAGFALRTSRTYDGRGEILSQTDAAGNVARFGYDGRGNLAVYTDAVDSRTLIDYDAAGRPAAGRDALGTATRASHDDSGRVTRVERLDSSGRLLSRRDFTYDANGNRLSETVLRTIGGEVRGLTRTFVYDARNRLVATVDPLGHTSRVEYNAMGKESAQIDALGRRTTLTYDAVGSLVRTDFPDGTAETRDYDGAGNLTRQVDRAGHVTTHEYDELNRRIRTVLADGAGESTIYSAGGRVTAVVDAKGARTDFEYDAAGRRTRMVQPPVLDAATGTTRRPETRHEYDAASRPLAVLDAEGHRTTLTYDGAGRITRRQYADGTLREMRYDALGHVTEQLDEAGRRTRFTYDALGRLIRVTDALDGMTAYGYDEEEYLLTETDALGRTTRYVHDAAGRLAERTLPDGAKESFTYDPVGNTIAHTDFNGGTTHFAYDSMNRLVGKGFPGGVDHTFTYTPAGNRATATDGRGVTEYQYDVHDRLVRVRHPGGEVIEYAYDANGNLRELASPAGAVAYEYDPLNRLSRVTAAPRETRYGYDAAGNLLEVVAPNGVVTSLAYDARNRLTAIQHALAGATLGSVAYELSPTGHRLRMTEADGSVESYSYDALDRLTGEVREGTNPRAIGYEYDAVSNRTRRVIANVVTSYAYDVNDRLLDAGATSYTYDANGNLLAQTTASAATRYDWDVENRLLRATDPTGVTDFAYDTDGNRVARRTGDDLTRFLVDGNNPTGLPQVLEERDAIGGLRAHYTYGNGLLDMNRDGATSFYQFDGLRSTRLLTNGAGAITDTYGYDGYGNLVAATGSTANPYLFAGQQFEPALGLYHLRARHYDPGNGRFLGRDPLVGPPEDPRTRHPYLYALADPTHRTDPTGLFSLVELFTALGIQDFLKTLDMARTGVQYCTLAGKLEIAQEALFWGQFAALGPALAGEFFGSRSQNASLSFSIKAKRYINVFKGPEKIKEAEASLTLERAGGKELGFSFTREDDLSLGVGINLTNPAQSTVSFGAGPVGFDFSPGDPLGSKVNVKKSLDIFKVSKCSIDLVKGKLEVGATLSLAEFKISACIVLEALEGILKFKYPIIEPDFRF